MESTKLSKIMGGCKKMKDNSEKNILGHQETINRLQSKINFEKGKLVIINEIIYIYKNTQ